MRVACVAVLLASCGGESPAAASAPPGWRSKVSFDCKNLGYAYLCQVKNLSSDTARRVCWTLRLTCQGDAMPSASYCTVVEKATYTPVSIWNSDFSNFDGCNKQGPGEVIGVTVTDAAW